MEFEANKPIAVQLVDFCRRQVLSGQWVAESRIESTKELAVQLAVNPRTVMKAYDQLAAEGVIYQRRGMGYFVAPDAAAKVREALRREFLEQDLPAFAAKMRLAGLTPEEVGEMLKSL